MFGPKREEVAGDWRRLHNEELHNLYPSSKIMRMRSERGACNALERWECVQNFGPKTRIEESTWKT